MKISGRVVLFAAALSFGASMAASSYAQINQEKAKVAANEAAAVALAEKAAAELVGGADKVAAARPFKATGHGDVWLVISQPVADPKAPAGPKKSIIIQLSAETGEIYTADLSE